MIHDTPSKARRLTVGEAAIARRVFGEAIDLSRVRIVGWRGGRFAFVIGSRIAFPPGAPQDFAAAPLWLQAWLVHELTHVWQFQTRPLRAVASWLKTLVTGGYGPRLAGYRYGLPLRPWDAYNIEQQARIVEHGFLADAGHTTEAMPAGICAADYSRCTPFTPSPGRVSSDI